MLQRIRSDVDVHQIDARPSVIPEATRYNPQGRVEALLASNLEGIADGCKDLVVGMSVFDQNPDSVYGQISAELSRVLQPDGVVVYLHNEPLNLPATGYSLWESGDGRRLILPNNRWRPANDWEYCSGDREDIERGLSQLGDRGDPLRRFLATTYPHLDGLAPTGDVADQPGESFFHKCDFPVIAQLRQLTGLLRDQFGVSMTDQGTGELLSTRLEQRLFCTAHGWQIVRAGMFEIRRCEPWKSHFPRPPVGPYFVRGIGQFGYVSQSEPPANLSCRQDLNGSPIRRDDELGLIAYQYGVIARKVS
jgi:hypothetical protein